MGFLVIGLIRYNKIRMVIIHEELPLVKGLTLEICKKFRVKYEQKKELAELDTGAIISSGINGDHILISLRTMSLISLRATEAKYKRNGQHLGERKCR